MKYILLFVTLSLILYSFITKDKSNELIEVNTSLIKNKDSVALRLFTQKCMICHETLGKTDTTMLAPPFFQIKKRYMMASFDKDDFIETMTDWVNNPSKDKAMMRMAVKNFDIMPHLNYPKNEVEIIVNYIYENEMPKPIWFEKHQRMHRLNRMH